MVLDVVGTFEVGDTGVAHLCKAGTVYAELWGKARHFQTADDFIDFMDSIMDETDDEADELRLDGGEPLAFGL